MRTSAFAFALALLAAPALAAPPTVFHVKLAAQTGLHAKGRLLIFAEPLDTAKAEAKGKPLETIEVSPFNLGAAAVAAQEVTDLAPEGVVDVDADVLAFPQAFSRLKPGRYAVQAVLDQNHSYNYSDRGPGDLVSPVVEMDLPAGGALTLDTQPLVRDPWTPPASLPKAVAEPLAAQLAALKPNAHGLDVDSAALGRFWGRPVHMRGWVVTPPGYADRRQERYPTVYWTHGFGGNLNNSLYTAAYVNGQMAKGAMPPMIWVFLDESSPTGTHEFADSVNNGPWGQALTTELIPQVERDYRTDGKPSGRFLNGHSSGGWAVLWLQTRYPKVFGGAWPTSPDPSDFHDFTGPDLYAPNANVYAKADGSSWPIMRDKGEVKATLKQFAQLERVLGPYGGQMASFEWVFSPKGQDGAPQPMFDRDTGAVDPAVVAYWRDHYDIAYRLQRDWPMLKGDLDGKVHLTVGTADTFYLDGAAHRLEAVMKGLGAKTDFRYLDGRTHFDLYKKGDDRQGLLTDIAWEMYVLARPGNEAAGRLRVAGLAIREFSDDLAPAFRDINTEWISAMYRLEPTDVDVLDHPRERIVEPGGAILFVEAEGLGLVGACALRKTGEGCFELTKMGVLEAARGRKAGEFLLQAAIARARAMRAEVLYLLSNKKSAAAIHLYEKLGFVHDAGIMAEYGSRYARCDVAMRYAGPPAP